MIFLVLKRNLFVCQSHYKRSKFVHSSVFSFTDHKDYENGWERDLGSPHILRQECASESTGPGDAVIWMKKRPPLGRRAFCSEASERGTDGESTRRFHVQNQRGLHVSGLPICHDAKQSPSSARPFQAESSSAAAAVYWMGSWLSFLRQSSASAMHRHTTPPTTHDHHRP